MFLLCFLLTPHVQGDAEVWVCDRGGLMHSPPSHNFFYSREDFGAAYYISISSRSVKVERLCSVYLLCDCVLLHNSVK